MAVLCCTVLYGAGSSSSMNMQWSCRVDWGLWFSAVNNTIGYIQPICIHSTIQNNICQKKQGGVLCHIVKQNSVVLRLEKRVFLLWCRWTNWKDSVDTLQASRTIYIFSVRVVAYSRRTCSPPKKLSPIIILNQSVSWPVLVAKLVVWDKPHRQWNHTVVEHYGTTEYI